MDLTEIFKEIKEKFSPRKEIDFEKEGFHFEVEPLTSTEDLIIMESIQEMEGGRYLEGLKRHTLACAIKKINDHEIKDEIEYVGENNEKKVKSRFLFMVNYTSQWPTTLIDALFDAYSNMLTGLKNALKSSIKFERVALSEEIEEDLPEKLRKVEEDSTEGMTETERLNKKVNEERAQEEMRMAQASTEAVK